MKKVIPILLWLSLSPLLFAQTYTDYLGAGHSAGITVTTSHNQNVATGHATVNGFPLDAIGSLKDASRFLAQSTLGYDYENIQTLAATGYEAWIDQQFALPRTNVITASQNLTFDDAEAVGLLGFLFRTLWWELALKESDLLRQRITYSLSQVFVISSFGSDLFEDVGMLSFAYYDLLSQHAFGNYRDLLVDISRSPAMGLYLSHMHNPKADPANNIHPDENYAREIMQLFSIGLYELNNDGTRKTDTQGNLIPTYDNNDIKEFAKIFTGFGNGHPDGEWGEELYPELPTSTFQLPMRMYEEWHEPGSKNLLNGQVVPAGQTGLQDFEDAIDNLFHHPNVGPFIGRKLIQLLVTSNPSPEYVNRVANAFNDNGQGIRGDFKAVIKAILLDTEARNCDPLSHPTGGKLREPLLRYSSFVKAFNPISHEQNGIFSTEMEEWYEQIGQVPLYANSVFNFYLPDFQPNGDIANNDLFAPVFQIHNSSTSIGYINQVNRWTLEYDPFYLDMEMDYSDEIALLENPVALVERLDILLACGQLSETSKSIIANAIAQLGEEWEEDRLMLALYLVMISPEYAVLK